MNETLRLKTATKKAARVTCYTSTTQELFLMELYLIHLKAEIP